MIKTVEEATLGGGCVRKKARGLPNRDTVENISSLHMRQIRGTLWFLPP